MNVVNLIQQSMITGKRNFISPRKLYLSRFVLKTLKDVKLHSLLDDLMYESLWEWKKQRFVQSKIHFGRAIVRLCFWKKMNTLKHFVNTSLIFLMSRNPTRDWDLLIFLRHVGDYTHSLIQRMFQNIVLSYNMTFRYV